MSIGGGGIEILAVGRRPPQGAAAGLADAWVPADLADPASLRGVCEGADVLLHLAAALGPDDDHCAAVNVRGTAALMEEAVRAGTGRIVHLSTAAVYGPGPHHGIPVNGVEPVPVSPASRTRLAGETYALAAGATVLRPGLVLGAGDRWVIPALARLVHAVPALWDGGRGLLSMVAVEDLARLITLLGVGDAYAGPGGGDPAIFHASHPQPVRTGELLATLSQHGVLPAVTDALPWDECLRRLKESDCGVSERQFSLLAQDHWYESTDAWVAADCPPGPGPLERLKDAADWYRGFLGGGRT
ncbi:NAD(P)-dependent oxidoreductase [Streptomyces sp. NPDC003077]|uniref:NAD-dependent epimerase/dehydratase family protein n=1 Tax=Streptomyces sp. NPDC003077 TaxID=3154443 RepID=UPI0033A6604B